MILPFTTMFPFTDLELSNFTVERAFPVLCTAPTFTEPSVVCGFPSKSLSL